SATALHPDAEPQARPRVLVVSMAARAAEWQAMLGDDGLTARGVRAPADAFDIITQWKPCALVIDATLEAPTPARLIQHARAVQAGWLCILVAPSLSENALSQARACDADTVLALPLERVTLRRLVIHERGPVRTEPREPTELPDFVAGSSAAMQEVWRL